MSGTTGQPVTDDELAEDAEIDRADELDEDDELDGDDELDEDDEDEALDEPVDLDRADGAGSATEVSSTGVSSTGVSATGVSAAGDTEAEDAEAGETEAERVARLEREGDIAADYLEELLDIADLDGDIDLDVENDRAMVSIVGSNLGSLVGSQGATLDALQDLTRLAVLRVTGERSRLMLDIGGTRARRREQLEKVGTEAAERARTSGEPVRLDPMTPFERKVVHDAVAAAGLRSESDGVEPNRRVVVYPG